MEFHGSNAALGAEQVEITDRRVAEPLIQPGEEQQLFPRGLAGLVPVRTTKANGAESLTYVFPFGEGVLGDFDEEAYEDAPRVEVAEEEQPVLDALLGAVELINGLLAQASELSGYTFGQVCAAQIGVTELGVGFTRVEPFPADRDKAQAEVALTLHIETTDAMPGTTESFSAVVDYDAEGDPIRIAMLEYDGEGYVFRAAANIDEVTDRLSISKVERINRATKGDHLLYKRGRDNTGREQGGRRGGGYRGDSRGRGYDDRRAGRYDRDERGYRGGYDDRRGGGRYDRGGYDDRPRGRRSGY